MAAMPATITAPNIQLRMLLILPSFQPVDVSSESRPGSEQGRFGSCCPPWHAGYVLIQQRLEEKVAACAEK
jgi:hypothetical protein